MTDFRVLVTGNRDWPEPVFIRMDMARLLYHAYQTNRRLVLVHGAHWAGGDLIVRHWVEEMQRVRGESTVVQESYPAYWATEGSSAGPKRNRRMVALGADLCLAYAMGTSKGTRGCARLAVKAEIPTLVTEYGVTCATTLEHRLRDAGIMILEDR